MRDLSSSDHDKPKGLSPHASSSSRVSSSVSVVQSRQSFAQRLQQRSCQIRQQQ